MMFYHTPTLEADSRKFWDPNLLRYFIGGLTTGIIESLLVENGNWFDIFRVAGTAFAFSIIWKGVEFAKCEIEKCRQPDKEETPLLSHQRMSLQP